MATQYEYLRIEQTFFRRSYWELVKSFLPRGPIWRIPMPEEQDVRVVAVESSFASDDPTVVFSGGAV